MENASMFIEQNPIETAGTYNTVDLMEVDVATDANSTDVNTNPEQTVIETTNVVDAYEVSTIITNVEIANSNESNATLTNNYETTIEGDLLTVADSNGNVVSEQWKRDEIYNNTTEVDMSETDIITFTSNNTESSWVGKEYLGNSPDAETTKQKLVELDPAYADDELIDVSGNTLVFSVDLDGALYHIATLHNVEGHAFKQTSVTVNIVEALKAHGIELQDTQRKSLKITQDYFAARWGSMDAEAVTVTPETPTTTIPEQTTTTTTPEQTTTTTIPEQIIGTIPPVTTIKEPTTTVPETIVSVPANPETPEELAHTGADSATLAIGAIALITAGLMARLRAGMLDNVKNEDQKRRNIKKR